MNKQHNNMKGRQRGRNGGKPRPGGGGGGGGGGRNPNYDSGGGGRPRGSAQQLMEKFLAMARDASSAGDRVLAENYFQHADHYYRVLNARFEQQGGQPGGSQAGNQQGGQQGQQGGQRPPSQNDYREQGYDMRRNDQQSYDRQGSAYQGGNQGNQGYQGNQGPSQQAPAAPQAQPQYAPAQPQAQPVARPSMPEPEIGLPPGILGIAPELPAAPDGDTVEPVRRRRGPRGAGE